MKTISQVAELSGINTLTLQYYDEIGLLKPSKLTQFGYRVYNDDSLQKLRIENCDLFIQKVKDNESEVARLVINQFGSNEKYTKTMKFNLEHFSEIVEK